ncbi:ComEC/Rec2 family competence protein [Nonomuraea muscovyensis]
MSSPPPEPSRGTSPGTLLDTPPAGHSWILATPALFAWAATVILVGCSPLAGLTVSALALLAALGTARCTTDAPTGNPGATQDRKQARKSGGGLAHRRRPPRPRRWAWRNMTVAALVCTAAASASVALRVHAVSTGPVSDLAAKGATITARITLTDDPKLKPGRFGQQRVIVPATLEHYQTTRRRQTVRAAVLVLAQGDQWRSLLPSQQVEVTARLARPVPGELISAVLLVRGAPKVLTAPSRLQTIAGTLRAGLRTAADVLPADQRGLLPGLVVGDVSRMDPQVSTDLQEAGLSHLNAVSGTNLSIVAGAALALARLAGLPLAVRALLAAIAMIGFAVVARPSPSVLRALLMGLVAAIALGTGRARDGVAALSVAILLLILFAPELARSYGFALSVFATAGILLLAPRWRDRLAATPPTPSNARSSSPEGPTTLATRNISATTNAFATKNISATTNAFATPNALATTNASTTAHARLAAPDPPLPQRRRRVRLPRWVAEAVAVPAAAQAAVTPLLVLMSGELSLVAVPANLLAGPAVAPATLLGFGAALVAPFWPEAAQAIVVPAGYAVGWIIMVARWAVSLPLAIVPWQGGIAGLALLAVVVAVTVVVLRRRAPRAVVLTLAGGALVAVLLVRPIVTSWPPKAWLMVACDVGQGDGLVIAAGPGRGVVVDAGPDPVTMDRCLRRLGIADVPLVILTHPHADHVDGLPGVFQGRRVGGVVVSPHPSATRHAPGPHHRSRLSVDLARRRIPQWTASPGSQWRLGPSEVTVLAPDLSKGDMHGQGEGSGINNSSVVVHVRWRAGSALLSGDIETEAQRALLGGNLPRADILKVPHHGSPRQDPAFFSAVAPRAALISVGTDNDYGHPAELTVAILHRLGARVYRTDRSGDLAVVEHEGRLAVLTRGR